VYNVVVKKFTFAISSADELHVFTVNDDRHLFRSLWAWQLPSPRVYPIEEVGRATREPISASLELVTPPPGAVREDAAAAAADQSM